MNIRSITCAAAAALAASVALTSAPSNASSQAAPSTSVDPATAGVLYAGPAADEPTYVPPPASAARRSATPTATFGVSYTGFTPEAQAAFQRAVDIWSTQISSPVKIYVNANFADLGNPRMLGGAKAGKFWRDFAGAELPGTAYPDAIANKMAGKQLHTQSDIFITFNSTRTDWHFGEGPAPADKYDFTSVVLHELGHGLGTSGFGYKVGSLGTVRDAVQNKSVPSSFDRFTQNSAGKFLTGFADASTTLGSQLTSNRLYFTSPQVREANNGLWAKLYAPSTFEPGSSYSHLDEATFPAGDPNSLMTPMIGPGETIRDPGPITRAMYDTIGW